MLYTVAIVQNNQGTKILWSDCFMSIYHARGCIKTLTSSSLKPSGLHQEILRKNIEHFVSQLFCNTELHATAS